MKNAPVWIAAAAISMVGGSFLALLHSTRVRDHEKDRLYQECLAADERMAMEYRQAAEKLGSFAPSYYHLDCTRR